MLTKKERLRDDLPPLPANIKKLPVDERGYPVPWFVAWIDGKPEFRCADQHKLKLALKKSLCWVCGKELAKLKCFVIGPMCAINRVSAEPPCHYDCCLFSVKACPFLSKPQMNRRENCMPSDATEGAGIMIRRNPGVTLIWATNHYNLLTLSNGVLFRLGGPKIVEAYCEGRRATKEEIEHSIETGLPTLKSQAEAESPSAVTMLVDSLRKARKILGL